MVSFYCLYNQKQKELMLKKIKEVLTRVRDPAQSGLFSVDKSESVRCLFVCLSKYSSFTVLCQSLLYSRVTQFYTYIHSFFNILFYYGLSWEIGYSSLCSTVGPCCLSILNVIVCSKSF